MNLVRGLHAKAPSVSRSANSRTRPFELWLLAVRTYHVVSEPSAVNTSLSLEWSISLKQV
jgi:hypothetical protein